MLGLLFVGIWFYFWCGVTFADRDFEADILSDPEEDLIVIDNQLWRHWRARDILQTLHQWAARTRFELHFIIDNGADIVIVNPIPDLEGP
jgi:hypothetical protein